MAAAADVLAGRLPLDVLRGRSCLPMPVQAAEIALLRHLGETGDGRGPRARRTVATAT